MFNRMWIIPLLFSGLCSNSGLANGKVDYKPAFGARDGCFVLSQISTGKIIEEYNSKRCTERFSPCSSFKIAAALMAFEKGILKDDNQVVKWDGVKRDREELNQDQTPYSWMKNSAMWVTQWITPQLGIDTIGTFLKKFAYGNQDFSGGITTAWQTSTLKISAHEQSQFIRNLWLGSLPVSKQTIDLTKKIIFIKKLGSNSELYGKTGTGCLVGHDCDKLPGKRMIGWFVGVLKNEKEEYAFAANASDLEPDPKDRPAGPRLRETTIDLLTKLGLVK